MNSENSYKAYVGKGHNTEERQIRPMTPLQLREIVSILAAKNFVTMVDEANQTVEFRGGWVVQVVDNIPASEFADIAAAKLKIKLY